MGCLGQGVSAAVEECEDFAELDIFGQKAVIGEAALAFVVEVDVAAVTKGTGEFVGSVVRFARASG